MIGDDDDDDDGDDDDMMMMMIMMMIMMMMMVMMMMMMMMMMMSRHLRRRVNFGCWRFGDFVNEDFGSTFEQTPYQLISTKMIMLTSHAPLSSPSS